MMFSNFIGSYLPILQGKNIFDFPSVSLNTDLDKGLKLFEFPLVIRTLKIPIQISFKYPSRAVTPLWPLRMNPYTYYGV